MSKTLFTALVLIAGGCTAAAAAPLAVPARADPPRADLPIVRVANGCGPGFFRTLAGQCFPNRTFVGPRGRVMAPPPCPPGFLRAPDRPLCFPVY